MRMTRVKWQNKKNIQPLYKKWTMANFITIGLYTFPKFSYLFEDGENPLNSQPLH